MSGGNVDLIRSDHARLQIVDFPPPLMRDNSYVRSAFAFWRISVLHCKHHKDRQHGQRKDRCNGPDNLKFARAKVLSRLRHPWAVAISDDREDDEKADKRQNNAEKYQCSDE